MSANVTAPNRTVDFDALPVAAVLVKDGVIVGVNAAYVAMLGIEESSIVGMNGADLVQRYVVPSDTESVERDRVAAIRRDSSAGTMWMRVTDALGRVRSLRVEWRRVDELGSSVAYLVEEEHDLQVRELTEGLARASAGLAGAATEEEVLTRAVAALVAHGFTASVLFGREGDGVVRQGPSGSPRLHGELKELSSALLALSQATEALRLNNPRFQAGELTILSNWEGFLDGFEDAPWVAAIRRADLGRHLVQVPLRLDDANLGAMVVTGDGLTNGMTAPLAMFGELVEQAYASVRMGRRLLERERLAALGEAAAVMAHEVRNPIAAILNAVTLLERESAPREVLLPVIAEESRRLDRLVSDLLAVGRPLLPRLVPAELGTLARQARDVFFSRGGTQGVTVLVEDSAQPCMVDVDAELLELALLNVLRNAVQASPAGGTVRVTFEPIAGQRTALRVEDDGPGFLPGDSNRALEPFFTTRATGTGIGLALVQRVVRACGGAVELGSSANGGARVTLLLRPATDRPT
jgi:two-component system sensor histidine kinase HydH